MDCVLIENFTTAVAAKGGQMADRPNPTKPTLARRRFLRRLMATMAITCVAVGAGSGCSVVNGLHHAVAQNDAIDEFMVAYRNRAWAAKSWHRNKHRFCNQVHQKDFAAGYQQGYIDAASGGNGCTPALAPKEYWGWKYQSGEGQAKVNAWFAGYPHGARAAEEDGLGNWSNIRTMMPQEPKLPPGSPGLQGPLPTGGAPTPVPMLEGPNPYGLGGLSTEPSSVVGSGNMDLSQIPRVPASSVPTVASGR